MKLLQKIKIFISAEMERYRKADEGMLAEWFETLYGLFRREEEKGRVRYETAEGIYKIKILGLPEVVLKHKKYRPQISEVNLVSDIIPEGVPEIQTWRLDLVLFNQKGKIQWPETSFSRFQFSQPQKYLKHEIRFSAGRELTAFEAKFIKEIFDKGMRLYRQSVSDR